MSTNSSMHVGARLATIDDVSELVRMYVELSAEQAAIREIWPHADGLDAPVETSLRSLVVGSESFVVIGRLDDVTVGFLVGVQEPLLEPMSERRIGTVHLIFTDHAARGVGVGAVMLDTAMSEFAREGIDLFDARVSPGHRLAKNFFESNGFKARSITMHRSNAGSGDLTDEPHERRKGRP